jgi:hypothetical protein
VWKFTTVLAVHFLSILVKAFADTPIVQSLLKLYESQRKRLESLFNTAYSVVKAGKPFSDYELICEIQVKNGLDLVLPSDRMLRMLIFFSSCTCLSTKICAIDAAKVLQPLT